MSHYRPLYRSVWFNFVLHVWMGELVQTELHKIWQALVSEGRVLLCGV